MTDEMRAREEAICEVAGVKDIGDLSDGFHTFNQLYYQRMILFATIVKQNRDKAWKSLRHEDGELCFGGGWFIVGVDTPEGSYTYHYEDNYYSLFDCVELECGKHWDGHTEKDVTRLLSLPALEKQEQVNTQSVNSTHTTYPNALESLKILESAKDENGCVPMSLVRLAFRNILEQDRWIPVTERLPEDDTEVFVYLFDSKSPYIAWICDGRWYTEEFEIEKEHEPVAWRPLPEPYTEEEA